MPTAAIYARVSSARQTKEQTIRSQTAALLAHAEQQGLDVPPQWVFEDEGYSGATLVRPALERLRDLVAQVPVEIVLCYAPDRLARRYAYQALLVEELARAGTEVCFLNGPAGDRPEDALLVQFQGMIAEYEKAQIIERTRRGKAHRAKAGSVNVLSGAPYGYRYVRKSDHAEARYELVEPQATVVRELFGRYIQDGASIADLARWLTGRQIPTRTGKARWDRSTVWGMLRNPAYAGRAAFAKTQRTDQQPRLTRRARLAGQTISRNPVTCDRPHEQWIQIAVPAIVSDETFQLAARRLADNRRFAARNTKVPSLLQGLAACASCGYAYYRTSARTSTRRLYYYRCLGSDDYRYPGGRRCANLPVRADYLDQVIWGHVTALLADPTLIRAELDRRLAELHAANPARATKARLQREATRTTTAISRLVEAYQEQLLSLEELRARTPALRAKEQTLRAQLDALDAQLVDQAAYLKLAETLESFLGRLRDKADTASVTERQRVLRLIVREVLIGPERVVVRHRIPVTSPNPAPGYLLRGRSPVTAAGQLNLPRFPGRFLFAWVADADGHSQPRLVLHRAQVADRGVPPGPVVDRLQPPEHLQPCLLPGAPVPPVDQLTLQRGVEALDQGMVEAVAHRPHRRADPQLLQLAAERQAGELRPLVRMMNQPITVEQAAAPHPKLHRGDGQLRGRVLADGMPDRQPGAAVDDRHQVQLALVGGQLGVVGMPHPVRPSRGEVALDQVRRRRGRRVAPGQATGVVTPAMAADQPGRSHQPGDPLAADPHAAGDLQLGMDPGGAVGATTVAVDPADPLQQPLVGQLAGGRATAVPVVEAGWGDVHRPAAPPHAIAGPVDLDEPVADHLVVSLANNAAALTSSSRSMRSSATSRRSRRSSWRSSVVSPSASPWSMRSWVTHSRSVSRLRPSSRATWVTVLSLERTSATASRRNSAG
jgi:site-specific DNA recombinase